MAKKEAMEMITNTHPDLFLVWKLGREALLRKASLN